MEIILSGNPNYHPIMQADPCVSSNPPLAWFKWRAGSPPVRFVCFFVRGEPAWGGIDLDAEIHYTLAAPGNITGTASINHCSCASEVTLNDMGKWKLNGRSLSYTPNNPSTTPPYVYFMEYIVLGSDISFLDSQLCIFWNCSSFL